MSSDEVRLESSACPLGCARRDELVVSGHDRLHDLPGEFRVMACRECGLMRTDPRPTPDTIGFYYPPEYAPYNGADTPVASEASGIRSRMRRYFGPNARVVPDIPPGRMLEIGCASGAYMEQMRRAGWDVEGIEFSEAAAHKARLRGFHVQVATVETAHAPAAPVDVVAAWMVLEHLHQPVAALKKILSWVRPDGYLIASVPDAGAFERRAFGSRWYALHLPAHLFHFTPSTITKLLEASGWQVERIAWQRNCNNLLWSLEYLARDRSWPRTERLSRCLRTNDKAGRLRFLLGLILGITRQSGRMEIWARPRAHDRPKGSLDG